MLAQRFGSEVCGNNRHTLSSRSQSRRIDFLSVELCSLYMMRGACHRKRALQAVNGCGLGYCVKQRDDDVYSSSSLNLLCGCALSPPELRKVVRTDDDVTGGEGDVASAVDGNRELVPVKQLVVECRCACSSIEFIYEANVLLLVIIEPNSLSFRLRHFECWAEELAKQMCCAALSDTGGADEENDRRLNGAGL